MQTKPTKFVTIIACLCLTACSKSEKRWGGSSGSQPLQAEVPLQLCYNLQGASYSGTFDPATAEPQFVILWKARRKGESTSDGNNRISEIHGHKISVSFADKAVYALQPDYSLKRLPLSASETNQILGLFSTEGAIKFNEVWDRNVKPKLEVIEDPTWNPPPGPGK
jgi:hypothetical protein